MSFNRKHFGLAALLFAPLASATVSDVTITGLLVGQQTSRPITLHRFFKQGEISAYAKPAIALLGVPAAWQNDVKKRWRDGTPAVIAVTGASNTSPIKITAANHGFQEGERVTLASAGGNTAANGTFTTRNVSTNTFDLVNSAGNGNYTSGGTVTGPSAGSLKDVLISFRADVPAAPGSVLVTFSSDANQCSSGNTAACNAAALDEAGMLAFNGGTWDGTISAVASSITHTASARTILDSGNFTYWMRGPVVTQVIAEDATTARTYDFGWTCTVLCTWDRTISTTTGNGVSPIVVTTTNPHDFQASEPLVVYGVHGNVAANGFKAPAAVASTTLTFTGTGNGAYESGTNRVSRLGAISTWVDDPTNRSLHPIYVLSFWAGWTGVKVEFILENVWSESGQDQFYDLRLSTSDGTELASTPTTQYAWTRWRRAYWDGSEPGGAGNEKAGISVNYNLAYIIESKMVLPYDLNMHPENQVSPYKGISDWISRYYSATDATTAGLRCYGPTPLGSEMGRCGDIGYDMTDTGSRGDIGPITAWDVAYLYTFDPNLRPMIEGNADNVGLMPLHIRESEQGRATFDFAGTVDSFGRIISPHNRPTLSTKEMLSLYTYTGAAVNDRITPVQNPLSRGHKWTLDPAHMPNSHLVAYMITGEWWYWSNLRDVADAELMWVPQDTNFPRIKAFGMPDIDQTRKVGWSLRDYTIATDFTPDGFPEQYYFHYNLNNWIAIQDGVINNTASIFYDPGAATYIPSTEQAPWAYGRGSINGMFTNNGWPNPLGLSPGTGECNSREGLDTAVITLDSLCGKPFMWAFFGLGVNWMGRLGHPVIALQAYLKAWTIQQLLDPAAANYAIGNYNTGDKPGNLTPYPTLTGNLTTTTLTIPVSSIPAIWLTAPTPWTITIGGTETIKVVSVDAGASTVTTLTGTKRGRGFGNSPAASHTAGETITYRPYFQTWADQKTGFDGIPSGFAWIAGQPQNYTLMAQALVASYGGTTSGGYSADLAYAAIETAFLTNSVGQADGANDDPRFKFALDQQESAVPSLSIGGAVKVGGAVVIH